MIQNVCLCKMGLSFVRIEQTAWSNPSWKCMVCWLCKLPGTLCSWSQLLYTPKGNTSLENQYGYYDNFKIQCRHCFVKQMNPPGNIAILAKHKTFSTTVKFQTHSWYLKAVHHTCVKLIPTNATMLCNVCLCLSFSEGSDDHQTENVFSMVNTHLVL